MLDRLVGSRPKRCYPENRRAGLQQRRGGLLNHMDNSLAAARFEACRACDGYFSRCAGNRQKRTVYPVGSRTGGTRRFSNTSRPRKCRRCSTGKGIRHPSSPGLRKASIGMSRMHRDSQLVNTLGGHDIVFASKFLFHMESAAADKCLRNVSRLVNPAGHLFVSGADLDVRSRVMRELGWTPLQDRLEEMHDGDPQVRRDWPWRYWGLEPLAKSRPDWSLRYASLFPRA